MTNLFYKKNYEKLHSHSGFSIYVINNIWDKNIPMIVLKLFVTHVVERIYFIQLKIDFLYNIYK